MKGTESSGPQGAFWMGSIQAALWGFYGNRRMFLGVTCGGAVAHSLSLSGKWDLVPLPS